MHTPGKLIALAALAAVAVPAHAQEAYATGFTGVRFAFTSEFGTVNLQTGVFSPIAARTDYASVRALSFGSNGTLYALTFNGSDTAPIIGLDSVDPATGALTVQNAFAGNMLGGVGGDSQGVFIGFRSPDVETGGSVFTFNPVTQTFQNGTVKLGGGDGLVIRDNTGTIYTAAGGFSGTGTDDLLKYPGLNASTSTDLGDTGINTIQTGLLANGNLYAFGRDAKNTPGLYTLSTTTGAASLVALTTQGGPAFVNAAVLAPSPEPSPVVAVLVGIMGTGALCVRARRKAAANA